MDRVLITGASGGIGRALAKGFSKAGYFVIAADIIPTEFQEENILFVQTDLEKEQDIRALFDNIKKECGPLHILINNAGISKFHKSIRKITPEEFDRVLHVNLRGSFLCAKAFVQANEGEDYGRIIQLASTRWHQNE